MKERAREVKAARGRSQGAGKVDDEKAVLAKIAEMAKSDRVLAERVHAVITAAAPDPLAEALVRNARICQGRQGRLFLQAAAKFEVEVRDIGVQRPSEPRRWRHVAHGVCADGVDPAEEERIGGLVKRAVS